MAPQICDSECKKIEQVDKTTNSQIRDGRDCKHVNHPNSALSSPPPTPKEPATINRAGGFLAGVKPRPSPSDCALPHFQRTLFKHFPTPPTPTVAKQNNENVVYFERGVGRVNVERAHIYVASRHSRAKTLPPCSMYPIFNPPPHLASCKLRNLSFVP